MILDTNCLSALADGEPEVKAVLEKAEQIAIPAIVLGEYRYGISQSRKHAQYGRWLERLLAVCRVLAVDGVTAEEYAVVRLQLKRKGRPIPGNDIWIAALARQHGMPLISRDEHFDAVTGMERIGWRELN